MNINRSDFFLLSLFAIGVGNILLLFPHDAVALYKNGDYWPKSADGSTSIPICFESTGEYSAQDEKQLRSLVQESLAATWGRWTQIKFSGFNDCTSGQPSSPTLTIKLTETPYGHAQWGGSGDIPDQVKHTTGKRGYQLIDNRLYGWLALKNGTTDRRILGVVAHEVGHALGFEHEQSRSDAAGYCPDGDSFIPGTELTTQYDDLGVMNYCAPIGFGRLSWADISGAQGVYGTSVPGHWLKALPALTQMINF
jgi:hypothetical protein